MTHETWLAERFDEHRPHLRAVAYRMLGSTAEADDAVQDAWLRVSNAGADDVDNLGGWLTTIVARVSLNMLRSRGRRREESIGLRLPDPIVSTDERLQPEDQALLADSVSLALLVVLDSLSPAERLAFVLHDTFEVPFDEIAPMIDRTPAAARQLASRARRRVRGAEIPDADPDRARQREVVNAFFRATRAGDFESLVQLLHPDVVLRADFGARRKEASTVVRGVEAVSRQARWIPGSTIEPALVNGLAGALIRVKGRPLALMGFTVVDGRIMEIDAIADPERVSTIAEAM